MIEKPKILLLIGAFLPGYKAGGPVPSVANMVARLSDDFDFHILTRDRDLGDTVPYRDVPTDRWISAYGAHVRYCSPAMQGLNSLASVIRDTPHALLYLNSFFSTRFTVMPLFIRKLGGLPKKPTILAPRGEFSCGALALKRGRKRAYIGTGKALGLYNDLHWHASTEHESRDIQVALGAQPSTITTALDLSYALPAEPPPHHSRAPGEPLRLLFLSRISPMKNLGFIFEVLSGMELPIALSIIGPEEDAAYSAHCREMATQLPPSISVKWGGSIAPQQVPQAMAENDLFILPTRGENFGHVIAEALGAGTPVLLSDTTPWRGLKALGVGDDLPLGNPELFRDALRAAWHQSPAEAAKMRRRAALYVRKRQKSGSDIEANINLFRRALSAGRIANTKY